MNTIQKNIWFIFYIICLSALLLLGTLIYNSSINIKNSYQIERENIVKLSSKSLESIFLQYETVLNILGDQLTQNNNYQSLSHSRSILDNILKLNPSLVAFGLAKPNGQLYVISSNLKDVKKLPNLLEKKETKETFELSLKSSSMVIGRTYFHKILNTFVIPIRKSIYNKNNEVIAVMSAGINVNKSFEFLRKNNNIISIFRDFDYYQQLQMDNKKENKSYYDKPIDSDFINNVIKITEKKYNKSINEIKNSEEVITIYDIPQYSNGIPSMMTYSYIKRYDLWMLSSLEMKTIKYEIFINSIIMVLVFIFSLIIIYYLFKYIDIYEKKKKDLLEYHVTHDYLTKIHNRYYLENIFNKMDKKEPFYLLFIDIDNFKSINDNYGHEAGDKVLKLITERIKEIKDSKDHFVRYSGDEFLYITYKKEIKEIKKLAQDIISKISQPYKIKPYNFIIGCSIGISHYPTNGNSFDEIKKYADVAMYESKIEKNKYTVFNDTIKNKFLEKSIIEEELKTAIINNEIYMMYQPQIRTDGTLYGVEALVRWENKKLGFIPPDKFIKIAEETGLMNELGKFIIKTSLLEIKDIQNSTKCDFQLSINISVKQFMEINFYNQLLKYIEEYNFSKSKITLEITENIFINDIDFILNILYKLKKQNIVISLDDFGTGYSSLSLLKKLPINELKIDKSFVDDILDDSNALSMIESIITIAKKLDMIILAEGIEKIEQKELLEKYGCSLFQGYYYSKPLKIKELESFLNKIN